VSTPYLYNNTVSLPLTAVNAVYPVTLVAIHITAYFAVNAVPKSDDTFRSYSTTYRYITSVNGLPLHN
jgi:hypothetical protein